MSFSVSGRVSKGDDLNDQMDKVLSPALARNLDDSSKELLEKVASQVKTLVRSGKLGEGEFQVSITGHANPDFKDRAGYAKESVNISVSRV